MDLAALEQRLSTPMRTPSQLGDIEENPATVLAEPPSPMSALSEDAGDKLAVDSQQQQQRAAGGAGAANGGPASRDGTAGDSRAKDLGERAQDEQQQQQQQQQPQRQYGRAGPTLSTSSTTSTLSVPASATIDSPATPLRPAAKAPPAMGRLDTIKLSAQVAREQLDAHGGESALLRQQVGERKGRERKGSERKGEREER